MNSKISGFIARNTFLVLSFSLSLFAPASLATTQVIQVSSSEITAIPSETYQVTLTYVTETPEKQNTRGLNLRIHFDSAQVSTILLTDAFSTGLVGVSQPTDDQDDLDGDPLTDQFIIASWIDLGSAWPNEFPAVLGNLVIQTSSNFEAPSTIRFTGGTTGSEFSANAIRLTEFVSQVPVFDDINAVTVEATDALTEVVLPIPTVNDPQDGQITPFPDRSGPFPVGENTIIWTAIDSDGNSVNKSQLVIVKDTTSPAFSVLESINVRTLTSSIDIQLIVPIAVDLVDGDINAVTDFQNGIYNLGTYTITWSAEDRAGNIITAQQSLTIFRDNSPPVIATPQPIVIEATGTLTDVELLPPQVTDNFDQNLEATASAIGPFPLGRQDVIWTATDLSGNTSSVIQSIEVIDTSVPVFSNTLDPIVIRTLSTTSNVELQAPVANDIVDGVIIASTTFPNGVYELGEYTITWIAEDMQGNQVVANQLLTIFRDNTAPLIATPLPVQIEATGKLTQLNLTPPSVVDDFDQGLVATPSITASLPLGTYEVIWTATDLSGNTASISQQVEIVDTTGPQFNDFEELTVIAENPDGIASDTSAVIGFIQSITANDTVSETIAYTFNLPPLLPLGQNNVNATAMDEVGNKTIVQLAINVLHDDEAPVFEINVLEPIIAEATGEFTSIDLPTPLAFDNSLFLPIITNNAPAAFPLGEQIVTWTASDGFGNSTTLSTTVTVLDTTAPIIESGGVVEIDATDIFMDVSNEISLSIFDLVDESVDVIVLGDALLESGKHIVTVQATDSSGNTASESIEVNINPYIIFEQTKVATTQGSLSIAFKVSGEPPSYPVNLSARLGDLIASSTLHEDSALTGQFEFLINNEFLAGESESLTLEEITNAHGNNTKMPTITFTDENFAPTVDIEIESVGNNLFVDLNQDTFLVTVHARDKNGDELETIITADFLNQSEKTNQFNAPTSLLNEGPFDITVTVREVSTSAQLSTTLTETFIAKHLEPLTQQDTDGDGLSDVDEGYSDRDGDGIPNYLDTFSNNSKLPLKGSLASSITTQPGSSLKIGSVISSILQEQADTASLNYETFSSVVGSTLSEVVPVGAVQNFIIKSDNNLGEAMSIVIQLDDSISFNGDTIFMKYTNRNGWSEFIEEGENKLRFATANEFDLCPEIDSREYTVELFEETNCIMMSIVDGGIYDFDELVNGQVEDPFVIGRVNLNPDIDLQSSFDVNEQDDFEIDASGTIDPEGGTLSYQWTIVDGSEFISLSSNSGSLITVTTNDLFEDATAIIELSVSDGFNTVTETISIQVRFVNQLPTVRIVNQTTSAQENSEFAISATASDPDGDTLTYKWEETSNVGLQLSNANTQSVTVFAPSIIANQTATLKLTVTDENGGSVEITHTVTIINIVETVNPPEPSNRDSGGGTVGKALLLLLFIAICRRYKLIRSRKAISCYTEYHF